MEKKILDIQIRENTGKEAAQKIRRGGSIPAVLYGHKGNKILSVEEKVFKKLFEDIGEHSIVTLNIDGKEKAEVIVKDFQQDPVSRKILHIDFLEFERGKLLKTEIPVKVSGTPVGVKKGGILEVFLRDIEIECLPKDIPDAIAVDVTDFEVGDSLHVKDLQVDKKLKVLSNPEQVVVAIGTPTKVEVPVAAEAEAVTEEGEALEEKVEGTAEEGESVES